MHKNILVIIIAPYTIYNSTQLFPLHLTSKIHWGKTFEFFLITRKILCSGFCSISLYKYEAANI